MKTVRFYNEISDMECLQGDTLPAFVISASADELTDCRMQMLLSYWDKPEEAVLCKECIADENGFSVLLTSDETQNLQGMFRIHFRFIGADGLSRRKLSGILNILPAPQGE